jgi:hypothetical protein
MLWSNRAFATIPCSDLGHSLSSGTHRSLTRGGRLLLGIVFKEATAALLLPIPCRSCQGFYLFMDLARKTKSRGADSYRFPAHYEFAVSGCCTVASHTTLLIFLVHASMITGATPLSRELVWRR